MPLPIPVGRQSDVLYFPHAGHIVVLGTAGSGKTTLAIHRAHHLATDAPNAGRTLLVTFNQMLATYLEAIAADELANVDVRTYHRFARGYLNSRGLMGWNQIAQHQAREDAIVEALRDARAMHQGSRILARDPGVLADEIEWIARMGIRTREAYGSARRVDRAGVRITRAEKPEVWDVYERYLAVRAARGYRYDWDDVASAVLEELERDTKERAYRHVVIDEGQDFSPAMLRSLAAAVPDDGTVTFFGDTAQQIYGSRVSWRDAGLRVDHRRIVHFEENYRNTQQIAAFALALAHGPHFQGTPDMVEPRTPRAAGTLPALVSFGSEADEQRFVVQTAARLGRTRTVAVLLRDRVSHEDEYLEQIAAAGVRPRRLHRDSRTWDGEPSVWVGTHHSAKGLEFDAVILPHLDDATIPNAERIEMLGDAADVCRDDAKLLYVAATRARAELVMTYHSVRTRLLDGIDAAVYQSVAR